MTRSSRYTLAAALALVLVTNGVVLLDVYVNRSGPLDAAVTVTERELSLLGQYNFAEENSGLSLHLNWRVASREPADGPMIYNYSSAAPWLDRPKLAALGFDLPPDTDSVEGQRRYDKLLPREALVVLEYDGDAYRRMLGLAEQHLRQEEALLAADPGRKELVERVERARRALDLEQRSTSRLFVIDAGTDHDALRAQYADRSRSLIARANISVLVERRRVGGEARVTGVVREVHLTEVNVPRAFRYVLDPLVANRPTTMREANATPRYTVTLNMGRRLEPWIAGVSKL